MIVVIAILAAISIVAYNGMQTRAKASTMTIDIKNITQSLELYRIDNGKWPCFDHTFSDASETVWAGPYSKWPKTPNGSAYHWEHVSPVYAGEKNSISIQSPGIDLAQAFDKAVDDGNLSTGKVRGDGSRIEYMKMEQVSTSHPGDDC